MTDELKAIEQRAAERRDHPKSGRPWSMLEEAEADLDRAIEIAKKLSQRNAHVETQYKGMYDWRDKALAVERERDQARADVLKLRDIIKRQVYWRDEPHKPLLADTEHYEQYR